MTTTAGALARLGLLRTSARGAAAGDAEAAKACCAAAYGLEPVELFLGQSFHPGGPALTRRLAELVTLAPGERVLDVAAGIGTSALLLAAERGVEVLGLDLGERQVERARERADAAGLSSRARFEVGDAEHLPLDDDTFDVVVCECSFCTFVDKETAARELVRVVRPGGRVAVADVWLDPATLDPELAGLAGRVACLADARPVAELCDLLGAAGCTVTVAERHDDALAEMIRQVQLRLRALRIMDLPLGRTVDLRRGVALAGRAADVVRAGDAGYVLVGARTHERPPDA